MISAGMTIAVFVIVMIAGGIRVLYKRLCKESCHSFIGVAYISAVKSDTCLLHSHLSSAADTSADQNVSLCVFQEPCKRTMSCTHCSNYLLVDYLSVSNIVELKLLCPAEVLKDLSVFIGYCDSHNCASFLRYLL